MPLSVFIGADLDGVLAGGGDDGKHLVIQLLLSRCVCIEKSRENIKTLVFVLKVIDDVFSFLFRVLELLRKSDWGNNILMSWPSKNVLICQQDTADHILSGFKKKGWIAYRIYEVDMEEISEVLK